MTWTLGAIGAGGDTSVNVIRALFYNLLKAPPDTAQAQRRDRLRFEGRSALMEND